MFKRLSRLLIVLALASSVGLHWSFLQSFAWTTMVVDNLATTSFSRAVQLTFDGKHPCPLCKIIAEGKKSERKSDTLLPIKKFEGFTQSVAVAVPPPAAFPQITPLDTFPETLLYAPPTPPPRAV